MNYRNLKPRYCEKGQNLVELALLFPLVLIILVGVLDLGRIFFAEIAVVNAAREGVRYLTSHPKDRIGGFGKTIEAARNQAEFSGFPEESFGVTASCTFINENDDSCDAGRELDQDDNTAVVTVTYEFDLISGWFLPDSIVLSHSASMVVP